MRKTKEVDRSILDFFMAELAFKAIKSQDRIKYLWLKYVRENQIDTEGKSFDYVLDSLEYYYKKTNTKRKHGIER